MANKVVYALVSNTDDFYYEELYISLVSMKKYNPTIDIYVLVDDITNKTLNGFRSKFEKLITKKIVITLDNSINMHNRSRYLKINSRLIIDGDFVFIDVDTVIADDISELYNLECDIAGVYDRHCNFSMNKDKKSIISSLNKCGFDNPINDEYYNSGVLFIKDSNTTREFCKSWYKNYLHELNYGVKKDQVALSTTNCQFNGIIKPLDGIYNCQMDLGVKHLGKAKIIHYLGLYDLSNKKALNYDFIMFEMVDLKYFKELRTLEDIPESIKNIIDNPRESIRNVITLPIESTVYKLITSNHFMLLMIIFKKINVLYRINEKLLGLSKSFFKKVIKK